MELQPGDRPQTVKAWLEMLKPPKPKPAIQPKYVAPPTVLLSPQPEPSPPLSKEDGGVKDDRNSQKASRRNWLKYSGLAIASMVFALVGKEIVDNSGGDSDSNNSTDLTGELNDNSSTQTDPIDNQQEEAPELASSDSDLAEYEFDVITVNDRGEKINREQGSAKYFTEDLGNGVTLDMVEILADTFIMGSPEDELKRYISESPQHEVTVPSFYIAKYQVTQAQWRKVAALPQVERELKPNPSKFKGDDLPVERVSWNDAVEFCKRLSQSIGKEYRLPSEAEWEYAARAGTTTPFYFGETITSDLANYRGTFTYANVSKGEYRKKTTPVGSFPANAFGLYDMHGNVWEWCEDDWHNNYQGAPNDGSAWLSTSSTKVIRGGS